MLPRIVRSREAQIWQQSSLATHHALPVHALWSEPRQEPGLLQPRLFFSPWGCFSLPFPQLCSQPLNLDPGK